MKSEVVAVLVAYWPERFDNIGVQVEDLLASTVVPDKIIIINNNPNHELRFTFSNKRVSVLESSGNFTSRSKYAVAMLEPSKYYVLLDDDLSVTSRSIETAMSYMGRGVNAVSDWGTRWRTHGQTEVKGDDIKRPVRVDGFVGRFQFLTFQAIVNVFSAEAHTRIPNLSRYKTVAEDILVAMVNDAYVIPLTELKGLPQGSEAMAGDVGYYDLRKLFVYDARLALGYDVEDDFDRESLEEAATEYLHALELRDE